MTKILKKDGSLTKRASAFLSGLTKCVEYSGRREITITAGCDSDICMIRALLHHFRISYSYPRLPGTRCQLIIDSREYLAKVGI